MELHDTGGDETDDMVANLIVTVPTGLVMLLLFYILRRRLPVFYHRNVLLRGWALLPVPLRIGAWMRTVFWTSERKLLAASGIDGFVTVSLFKMAGCLCGIASIPCLLVLVPYYFSHADRTQLTYMSFSIMALYERTMWMPLLAMVLLTISTLYTLYFCYRSHVHMRQAYLLRPSALTSLRTVLAATEATGSLKWGRAQFDCSATTMLIDAVPSSLTSDRLQAVLEEAGIRGIERVQFVGNVVPVKQALTRRNRSLAKLETALATLHDSLSVQDGGGGDRVTLTREFTVKERVTLLRRLVTDSTFCASVRPHHDTSSKLGNEEDASSTTRVDSIQHHYRKTMAREEELQAALQTFNTHTPTNNRDADAAPVTHDDTSDAETRYIAATAFISLDKVCSVRANLADTGAMSLATHTEAALVTFCDVSHATRARQLLMNARAFELVPHPAVPPATLSWTHMKWAPAGRIRGRIVATVLYCLVLLVYAPFIGLVAETVDLQGLGRWFPPVARLQQSHPTLRRWLQGFLAPFIMSRILHLTVGLLRRIVRLQGLTSKGDVQLLLESRLVFFLFFQLLIVSTLFSSSHALITSRLAIVAEGFIAHVRRAMPAKSHFFVNLLVQDIFHEFVMELLNLRRLVIERTRHAASTNPRARIVRDDTPPSLDCGMIVARFVVFPLQIVMAYAVITPLILLPAMAYFLVGYVVFRFNFLHFGRVKHETGGQFLERAAPQIIKGLLLGQLFLLVQMSQFRRGYASALVLSIVMLATAAYIPFMRRHFESACRTLSAADTELRDTCRVVRSLLHDQDQMLSTALPILETGSIVRSRFLADQRDCHRCEEGDWLSGKKSGGETATTATTAATADETDPLARPSTSESTTHVSVSSKTAYEPARIGPKRYWTQCPLALDSLEADETFDSQQLDHLVDTGRVVRPYEHPLLLRHCQNIVMPRGLPSLLDGQSLREAARPA